MKTSWLTIVLLVFAASRIQGQVSQSGPPASAGQGTIQAQDTPYAVVSKGANQQVWQKTTYETTPDGQQVPHIHKYTELATGLNFWDSNTKQWVDSKEEIDILPNGTAAAIQGQHQVYFPGDIYEGVIELVTPDGVHLQSRLLGLSYDDGTHTVLIAELTNSVGYLVGSNQVIYPDAFTDFKADLRYTYTKAGFSQDIIIREQPLTPESYGLNPATARLQVLTEFFNPPQPAVTTMLLPKQAGITLTDDNLDFGVMKMMPGQAFLLGSDAHAGGALVSKSWVKLEGRQFLVEEVPVEALADELAQLPVPQTASTKPNVNSTLHVVSAKRLLPPQRLAKTGNKTPFISKAAPPNQGLVLDYQTINSSLTNYTFRGDTTYYISGTVYLYGTNTIEGGVVLKYTNGASVNLMYSFSGLMLLNWLSTEYRPVIFTSSQDNSVGETISGSHGYTVRYANPVLSYPFSVPKILTLGHFRMANFQTGLKFTADDDALVISDAQFLNGNCAINIYDLGSPLVIQNALFANLTTAIQLSEASVVGENLTFSGLGYLTSPGDSGSTRLYFTNCILANVTNLYPTPPRLLTGSYNGFYKSPVLGDNQITNTFYPFQTAGAGNFYLANGCVFTNAGTTNIDPTLLADIATKTTYPPIIYSNSTISVNTTFSPQAQRDANSSPSLGYHYDPIDYVFGGVYVTNATVTVNPGTVIATFGTTNFAYGLGIGSGAELYCQGLANNLNRIVQYNTVQEQAITNWSRVSSGSIESEFLNVSPAATITCRFTDWSMPAQDAPHLNGTNGICNPINLQDCQFHGGTLVSSYPTINLTNCLFERVNASLWSADTNIPSLRNNLFWCGTFNFAPNVTNALVKDNLFDQTSISNNSGVTYNGGYNAFVTNYNRLQPTFTNDVVLSNSPVYQSSWLGNYYLPTNSPLINAGSTTADQVGLYHYTVKTNQIVEGTNTVSIGYHYVAVYTNGVPIDTNGDGIPDYLEDANGNGLVDSGEIGWNIVGDLGLKVLITRPKNNSIIP